MNNFEILTANRFFLELTLANSNESIDGIFLECKGFQQTQDVIEVCEVISEKWGNKNCSKGRVVRTKMPGNEKLGNITLRRGMTLSKTFWQWFQQVRDGEWGEQRKNASLSIYAQGAEEIARFELSRAWPVGYKFTDVNARSTEIEVEEVEVAFEAFERIK